MRITLVIATLSGGGAERVATNMANYWAAECREVTILTTDFAGQSPCYDLHPGVTHLDLADMNLDRPATDSQAVTPLTDFIDDCSQAERSVLISQLDEIVKLRLALIESRPEVVISYLDCTNVCALLAAHGLGLPLLVCEHCDPNQNFIGEGWEHLRRRLYPEASYVAVLTKESLEYFPTDSGIRGRIVPNAVVPPAFSSPDELPPLKFGKTLMAMGRLAHEKGFDVLLSAFALVAKKYQDWTLEIFGEGPVRPYLESCAERHGLTERVRMPGFTNQPFDALRRADLFALSSLDEGFSNVLLEAMACGVAVVSFDCPSGPRHIIRHGVDGILVAPLDTQAMAMALDHLMGDEDLRERLASKAPEVLERFGVEKVMGMWEELVFDCARHV